MPLTHSHSCKHCDTTWSCIGEEPWGCLLEGYEVKHHGCEEQLAYSKKMGRLLRNAGAKCIYNCGGPCPHPRQKEAA